MTIRRKRRDFGAVRQLPSGRWQASYLAVDGLRRTASSTFTTKTDAHAWLTVRQSELLRGDWIDPDLGRVSFDDFATRWIAEHRLSPRWLVLNGCLWGPVWSLPAAVSRLYAWS